MMEVNIEAIVPQAVTAEFGAVVPILGGIDVSGYATKTELNIVDVKVATEVQRAKQEEDIIKANAVKADSFNCVTHNNEVTINYNNIVGDGDEITIPAATTTQAGVMSAEDKYKLGKLVSQKVYLTMDAYKELERRGQIQDDVEYNIYEE